MSFTFTNYPILTPEQQNPMNALVTRAMETFGKGLDLSYKPREKEAEIFNKQIGPLATLGTTPTFMNDQQFQENLRNLISNQFPQLMQGEKAQGSGIQAPTYAGQAKLDASKALALAKELAKMGETNSKLSSAAGWVKKKFGDTGSALFEAFTGGAITPDLANKKHQLETKLSNLKNNLVQTHRLSPQDAERVFAENPDETLDRRVSRIIEQNPQLFEPINEEPSKEKTSRKATNKQSKFKEAPPGSIGLYRKGKLYFIPQDKVSEALATKEFTYE